MNRPISKDMDLEDVAAQSPKAIGWLTRKGVVCIQCGTPLWKTVEEAIRDAGYDDVDGMIREINESIKTAS